MLALIPAEGKSTTEGDQTTPVTQAQETSKAGQTLAEEIAALVGKQFAERGATTAPSRQSVTATRQEPALVAEPVCKSMKGTALQVGRQAVLRADNRLAQIQVREQPSVNAKAPHYGVVGDVVTVLDSFWAQEGCWRWYKVEFPSEAQGWIRGDLFREKA